MKKNHGIDLSKPLGELAATLINGKCSDLAEETSIASLLAKNNYQFPLEDVPLLSGRGRVWGLKLAYLLAREGYSFTIDQIAKIGDSTEGAYRRTLSIEMASHGHQFSFEEVAWLKNPKDQFEATLAHWLAAFGKIFSVDEIIALGNPVINYSVDEIYDYDVSRAMCGCISQISQDAEYKTKQNILHNGATIAHIMAREGTRFSEEEIIRLGNPVDRVGLTIKDWMEKSEKKASG
jgi:hypothetical protein